MFRRRNREEEERPRSRKNPDWMSRLPEALLHVPLWELALPGSHDSMCFRLDAGSRVVRSEPRLFRLMDRMLPCCGRRCFQCWTSPQSVLRDQCELGVRFLDLHITRKPATGVQLVFAQSVYTLLTVKDALCELAAWLAAHPKEIVIIACSHLEELSEDDHVRLVDFILGLFGMKLCSSEETPTLSSCWALGQQLVIFYDDQQVALQHHQLWTGMPYWYADSNDTKKVISYLEAQKQKGRPAGFYVSGLKLTEDASYVLLQHVKMFTQRALSPLLGWASEQRPGSQVGGVNIICCDFVELGSFCSLVIDLNYKRLGGIIEWEHLHGATP